MLPNVNTAISGSPALCSWTDPTKVGPPEMLSVGFPLVEIVTVADGSSAEKMVPKLLGSSGVAELSIAAANQQIETKQM